MWGCQEMVNDAMKEYKDCVDYTYSLLFGEQYQLINTNAVQTKCGSMQYVQCQQAVERKLSSCLDYLQRETLQSIFQLVDGGLRYWCTDYGRNLLEFYNMRGPDCFYQHQSLLRNCEAESPLVNRRLLPYDNDYCRTQNDVIRCMQQVYEKCLLHEKPELIRGFFNAMWTSTPCNTMTSPLQWHNAAAAAASPLAPLLTVLALLLLLRLNTHL